MNSVILPTGKFSRLGARSWLDHETLYCSCCCSPPGCRWSFVFLVPCFILFVPSFVLRFAWLFVLSFVFFSWCRWSFVLSFVPSFVFLSRVLVFVPSCVTSFAFLSLVLSSCPEFRPLTKNVVLRARKFKKTFSPRFARNKIEKDFICASREVFDASVHRVSDMIDVK